MNEMRIKQTLSRRRNVIRRAELVQKIVEEKYEPGNQSKSKIQAYRQHIDKVYPMGERTFWRLMSVDVEKEKENLSFGQLCLEFGN